MASHATVSRFTAAPLYRLPLRFPNRGTHTSLGRIRKIATLHTAVLPHGLRRRRGSLYYKRTGSLAAVVELPGDSKRGAPAHNQ